MHGLFDVVCRSSGLRNPHDEFKLEQSDLFTAEKTRRTRRHAFPAIVIRLARVRRVLEIGAFIGLSTMYFAKAVRADGEVVSIEKFDKFATIARRNFALNGLSSKIKMFDGDAFEVIDRLPRDQLFDLVFIDGNKERYKDYVIKTEPLLAKNGIMIVDDCFYHGDVLNPQPSDAKGVGTKACMDYLAGCNDWLRIALPLSNGLFMMIRNG